jgi:hypothetical protein
MGRRLSHFTARSAVILLSIAMSASCSPEPSSPVAIEDLDSASSPSGPTPLPIFGQKAIAPTLFTRADATTVSGADLRSPGGVLTDLDEGEVADLLGFSPLQLDEVPPGYTTEGLEVFPNEEMARQCFTGGNRPHDLPRLCISQSSRPFESPIGYEAQVLYLETAGLYIEYVYGGWIGVGSSTGPERDFQWDARMVPSLALRYASGSTYTEIACTGQDCLDLQALLDLATAPSGPA